MTAKDPQLMCDVCGTGALLPTVYEDEFKHGGTTIRVGGLESYVCDQCGADPVHADQARRNHARIADARRRADGMLTGSDIRALRTRLALTQQDAAELFGGGANAFSKYERGDVVQSEAMDRLLKLTGLYPFLLATLREIIGQGSANPLADENYAAGRKMSINDEHYRSRTLAAATVLVCERGWGNGNQKVA